MGGAGYRFRHPGPPVPSPRSNLRRRFEVWVMFWPFAPLPTSEPEPERKRDGIDKIIESEAFQADAKSDAALFWERARKQGDAAIREDLIQEARIKCLHRGGKP
jgi:hypothetical protein